MLSYGCSIVARDEQELASTPCAWRTGPAYFASTGCFTMTRHVQGVLHARKAWKAKNAPQQLTKNNAKAARPTGRGDGRGGNQQARGGGARGGPGRSDSLHEQKPLIVLSCFPAVRAPSLNYSATRRRDPGLLSGARMRANSRAGYALKPSSARQACEGRREQPEPRPRNCARHWRRQERRALRAHLLDEPRQAPRQAVRLTPPCLTLPHSSEPSRIILCRVA